MKTLLRDLYSNGIQSDQSEPGLDEYCLDVILSLYDMNRDGNIELKELSKILPLEDNFLAKFKSVRIFIIWSL